MNQKSHIRLTDVSGRLHGLKYPSNYEKVSQRGYLGPGKELHVYQVRTLWRHDCVAVAFVSL